MKLTVNDLVIAYSKKGSGKVILLLHGWGTNKESFQDIADALSGEYQVISIDFPGFGGSDAPKSAWTVEDYALCVKNILTALNIREIYAMIGHSFGCRIILKIIDKDLLQADKIVLIGAAGIRPPKSLSVRVRQLIPAKGLMRRLPYADRFRRYAQSKMGSSDYLATKGVMRQIFLNVINEDLKPAIKSINSPTLLIWGSEDNETPLSDARYFHSTIPNSSLKIAQEAGHFVYIEKSRKVIQWVKSFL
jgi:pimeloyl-ACP methyl ester carboxylesterase